MQSIVALAATLTLVAAAGPTLADSHSKAIDYRSSVMTVFKWNMGPMGDMVDGEIPYDKETFARHARDLAAAAHLDLLAGFPEGSDEGETDALPDIWLDWAGFQEKYQALKRATAELSDAAGGDLEAVKPKVATVGKACKSCHRAFKD
jgi:cytochrome c556